MVAIPLNGTVGIWTGALDSLPVGEAAERAAELEELGYAALWYGEAYGREAFTTAGVYLAATRTLTVATGIANIYGRDPVTANAAGRTLADAYPGRFVLGLGVSHQPIVEGLRGHDYVSPIDRMTAYLEGLRQATFMAASTSGAPPTVIAALGPRMLDVARDHADGAHPYLVTPEHTAQAASRLGTDRMLAVEQAAVLTADREVALTRAHRHLEIYTGLPNYRNSWKRQGFTDDDFGRGGSDRLAEALVVWGDEDAIVARVGEHRAAGATHVCLQVLGDDFSDVPAEDWRRLAPALTAD